jgi:hypothetical protein
MAVGDISGILARGTERSLLLYRRFGGTRPLGNSGEGPFWEAGTCVCNKHRVEGWKGFSA